MVYSQQKKKIKERIKFLEKTNTNKKMSKFYTANEDLGTFLIEELGFTFHDREESVKYYTEHNTGKQIKIDTEKNLISLMNKHGVTEEYSSSYTDNQIKKFLNK